MENHIKNYWAYFGYDATDYISCECGCGRQGQQYHHLIPRSSFGSKRKKEQDHPSNVICIHSECHERAHKDRNFNDDLKLIHRKNLLIKSKSHNITFKF